ncbi:MAG: sulfatase-like hydrolase/transferase [Acidobacteria bacterium]|nr:sulfatase-like hydrolase/transferase [Acidobacteriota bacterium]MCB9396993.1 sulfatase-like hydrolase/transferase [Acidobacteriota bacterium]
MKYTAGLILILGFFGCQRLPEYKQAPVVLITIDTLRSDHLPAYGYSKIQTPAISQLASEGLLFESAFTSAPMTLPAHTSLMTGLGLAEHGVLDNASYQLPDKLLTLASQAKAHNYDTAAFVSSMVLRRATGIDRGFDVYDDDMKPASDADVAAYAERSGQETLNRAMHWLEGKQDRPFFLWIHLYEPHAPYEAPQFQRDGVGPYDSEILACDALLNQLFSSFKAKGLYETTLWVLASDHGEALGEHGEQEHGLFVYRPTVQIPLILKFPGQSKGRRISENVSILDVKPTVARTLGWQDEGIRLDGTIPPHRQLLQTAYSPAINYGWHVHRAVIQDENHFVWGRDAERFNWKTDPKEQTNLLDQNGFSESIQKMLREPKVQQHNAQLTAEESELLASLGYAGGSAWSSDLRSLDRLEFLKVNNGITQAVQTVNRGEYGSGVDQLQPLLQQFPTLLDARLVLAFALRKLDRLKEAEFLLSDGLNHHPGHPQLLMGLAQVSLSRGDYSSAEQSSRLVLEKDPQTAIRQLIPAWFQTGQWEACARLVELAQKCAPQDPGLNYLQGRLAYEQARYADAAHFFEKITTSESDPASIRAQNLWWFGDALARSGDVSQAIQKFEQGLQLDPTHIALRRSLSLAWADRGQTRKAIQVWDEWVAEHPSRENYLEAAKTMQMIGIQNAASFYRSQANQYP